MTPTERVGALRNRLEELRNRGVGSNTTLEILIELTEIVAVTCDSKGMAAESDGRLRTVAMNKETRA